MDIIEAATQQIENSSDTLINIQKLQTSMMGELKNLPAQSSKSKYCICRIPKRLRDCNERVYKPAMVSIGPLHHGKEALKAMEEHKRRYLQDFLQRTKVSLLDYIKLIKEKEERLRNSYVESIELSSDDFTKMILVDAAFIIEVFWRFLVNERQDDEGDHMFNKPQIIRDISLDIWLLENQLPFFILENVFNLSGHDQTISFTRLTNEFLKKLWDLEEMPHSVEKNNQSSEISHLVDFLRSHLQPPELQAKGKPENLITPSLEDLQAAGILIKLRSGRNLFDIKFKDGVLRIPKLRLVAGDTEILLKNLLAFELCHCHCSTPYVNDYIITMSRLVNTKKDENILVNHRIAENLLGENDMPSFFKSLLKDAYFSADHFYFSGLIEELNSSCDSSWKKWRLQLRRDYFGDPWAAICVMQAIVLLVLTVIQVVYAIKSSGGSTTAKGN